jgi:OOP family OmpA-OmpF porin
MKKILLAALLLAPTAVLAQGLSYGPYLLGDLGGARYENTAPFPDPIKLGLGAGYRFNRNFAAELGLSLFSETTANTPAGSVHLRARSLHPAAVGLLPLGNEFTAFGKLGFSNNHAEGTNPAGRSFSTSDTDLYFGFGLQYAVNPKVGIRGQYENFGRYDSGPSPMRAEAVSIGVAIAIQ